MGIKYLNKLLKYKDKVILVLTMKVYGGLEVCFHSLILNLSARWRWVITLRSTCYNPAEGAISTDLIGSSVAPWVILDTLEEKIFFASAWNWTTLPQLTSSNEAARCRFDPGNRLPWDVTILFKTHKFFITVCIGKSMFFLLTPLILALGSLLSNNCC